MAKMVVAFYDSGAKPRGVDTPAIRTYHGVRNEVHDKLSGLRQPYKKVVIDANLGDMIAARNSAALIPANR